MRRLLDRPRGRIGETVVVSAQVMTAVARRQASDGNSPFSGTAGISFRCRAEQAARIDAKGSVR
jgi:hypothetical protein